MDPPWHHIQSTDQITSTVLQFLYLGSSLGSYYSKTRHSDTVQDRQALLPINTSQNFQKIRAFDCVTVGTSPLKGQPTTFLHQIFTENVFPSGCRIPLSLKCSGMYRRAMCCLASAPACGLQALVARCAAQNEVQLDLKLPRNSKTKLLVQGCVVVSVPSSSCLVMRGVRSLQSAPSTMASRDSDPLVSLKHTETY